MIEFTFWDILRNLLLAARWTILLSIVAFAGGCNCRRGDSPAADIQAALAPAGR